jgi:hypothetical protein
MALNKSELFELLRTPCGKQGEYLHDSVVDAARVGCTPCGATGQRHAQVATQKCPVRTLHRGGEEIAAATAVYAAWAAAVQAMHCRGRPLAPGPPSDVVVSRPEPALVPRAVALRQFRSHVVIQASEVEFCMKWFSRAPRLRTATWRAECCDGAAP